MSGDRDRSTELERFRPEKAVVAGAGMMGAAIAYVCARAGIEVVLKDVSLEAAGKGKEYSRGLVEKSVSPSRTGRAVQRRGSGRGDGWVIAQRSVQITPPGRGGRGERVRGEATGRSGRPDARKSQTTFALGGLGD